MEELLLSEAAAAPKASASKKKSKGKQRAVAPAEPSEGPADREGERFVDGMTKIKDFDADHKLRDAVESNNLEAISRALDAHRGSACEAEVARAVKIRDKLKDKRKRQSQQDRRAHALEMKLMQQGEPQSSPLASARGEGPATPTTAPQGRKQAPTARPDIRPLAGESLDAAAAAEGLKDEPRDELGLYVPDLSLLRTLTNGFSEALQIGVGGCAIVYRAMSPAGCRMAVKRAKCVQSCGFTPHPWRVRLPVIACQ